MVISRGCDAVVSTSGKLILAPDSTIAELVIMKMISRTRKMSVSGVMLISAMTSEPRFSSSGLKAISGNHALQQLHRVYAKQRGDVGDAHLEIIVKDQGDNRHAQ